MNSVIAFLLAVVFLGAGLVLIPAIKGVTDIIFSDELVATMPVYLQAFVGAWPFMLVAAFVFGAYMLVKKGSQ